MAQAQLDSGIFGKSPSVPASKKRQRTRKSASREPTGSTKSSSGVVSSLLSSSSSSSSSSYPSCSSSSPVHAANAVNKLARPVPAMTTSGIRDMFRCVATGQAMDRACFVGGLPFLNHFIALVWWMAMRHLNDADEAGASGVSSVATNRRCASAINGLIKLDPKKGRSVDHSTIAKAHKATDKSAFQTRFLAYATVAPGFPSSSFCPQIPFPANHYCLSDLRIAQTVTDLIGYSEDKIKLHRWIVPDVYITVSEWEKQRKEKKKEKKWSLFVVDANGKWVPSNTFDSYEDARCAFEDEVQKETIVVAKSTKKSEKVQLSGKSATNYRSILLADSVPKITGDEEDDYEEEEIEDDEEEESASESMPSIKELVGPRSN